MGSLHWRVPASPQQRAVLRRAAACAVCWCCLSQPPPRPLVPDGLRWLPQPLRGELAAGADPSPACKAPVDQLGPVVSHQPGCGSTDCPCAARSRRGASGDLQLRDRCQAAVCCGSRLSTALLGPPCACPTASTAHPARGSSLRCALVCLQCQRRRMALLYLHGTTSACGCLALRCRRAWFSAVCRGQPPSGGGTPCPALSGMLLRAEPAPGVLRASCCARTSSGCRSGQDRDGSPGQGPGSTRPDLRLRAAPAGGCPDLPLLSSRWVPPQARYLQGQCLLLLCSPVGADTQRASCLGLVGSWGGHQEACRARWPQRVWGSSLRAVLPNLRGPGSWDRW